MPLNHGLRPGVPGGNRGQLRRFQALADDAGSERLQFAAEFSFLKVAVPQVVVEQPFPRVSVAFSIRAELGPRLVVPRRICSPSREPSSQYKLKHLSRLLEAMPRTGV